MEKKERTEKLDDQEEKEYDQDCKVRTMSRNLDH